MEVLHSQYAELGTFVFDVCMSLTNEILNWRTKFLTWAFHQRAHSSWAGKIHLVFWWK